MSYLMLFDFWVLDNTAADSRSSKESLDLPDRAEKISQHEICQSRALRDFGLLR